MSSNLVRQFLKTSGHSTNDIDEVLVTPDSELYNVYTIRQGREGKERQIEEPIPKLKKIQQSLVHLYEEYPLHDACMSCKGRNILDNARAHKDFKHILRMDIKGCYQSIHFVKIRNALVNNSLNLGRMSYNTMSSALSFCLYETEVRGPNILPTGAPTSPILCNIALTPIDYLIIKLLEGRGYTYTRYMDDLHISTKNTKRDWNLIIEVTKILESHLLTVNTKKTRWMTNSPDEKIIVTGVNIGNGSNLPRDFRRTLRVKLQNLAQNGKGIDAETQGCLAYVKSIDEPRYYQFLEYFERRKEYAESNH